MNTTHLVAAVTAAALVLAAAPVFAQEGNGGPLPNVGLGTTTMSTTQAADVGAQAYPDGAGRPGSALDVVAGTLLSGQGNEAPVHTANSLPLGF